MDLKNKRQRNLIVSLVVGLISVIFVVLNTNPVEINFGFYQLKLPLIIVLVIMIIFGILIGYFVGSDQQIKKNKD